MHPPATAPATAQQASRGARSGSATASGANRAPLGPGTAELCSTSHVAVAVPAQPDSAQRCKAAMTRESIRLSNDAGAHRNGGSCEPRAPSLAARLGIPWVMARALLDSRLLPTAEDLLMAFMPDRRSTFGSLAALVTVMACSGGRSDAAPSTDSPRTVRATTSAPAANAAAPFAFTDADLDAYEKGMRKEIELV